MLRPKQKGDKKPTQKPSLKQPCASARPGVYHFRQYFLSTFLKSLFLTRRLDFRQVVDFRQAPFNRILQRLNINDKISYKGID